MILLLVSFLAGVLTILAPCILPILPVIVGGSVSGFGVNKKKVLTVVFSLGISILIFTLLLKASTVCINIPESFWKWFSGLIISFFGLITLFPNIWQNQIIARFSTSSNILLGKGITKKSFFGDVLVGFALGPVFSSCSPTYFVILATVLPASFILGLTYLIAYVLGLCLSLFIIALVGQKIITKLSSFSDPYGIAKKILGLLFLLIGIFIILGFDKRIQTKILDSGFFDITKVENYLLDKM